MLVKVKVLDYAGIGYAPIRLDGLLNTDNVVRAEPMPSRESRWQGPVLRVHLADGLAVHIEGGAEQLLPPVAQALPELDEFQQGRVCRFHLARLWGNLCPDCGPDDFEGIANLVIALHQKQAARIEVLEEALRKILLIYTSGGRFTDVPQVILAAGIKEE